jgi:hypothetical protein
VARARNAEEPQTDLGGAEAGQASDTGRTKTTDALWADTRIDPVEIAMPPGRVGYTLRAYRPATDVTPTDLSDREVDVFPERRPPVAEDEREVFGDEFPDEFDEDEEDEDGYEGDADGEEPDGDEDSDARASGDEDELAEEPEEIPVFLSHRGRLLLFTSAEGLVEFVKSGTDHDMAQLDTWPELVRRITPADVVPLAEDAYELDLVVENLRGGYDGWDSELIIKAGEVARDLGYALRIEPVIAALAPGSPLDDLDEALRATTGSGFGRLLARRRLRKIGAEAAPLGWRTIIGKISALLDWRD